MPSECAHDRWVCAVRTQDPQARLSRLRAQVGALPPAHAKPAHAAHAAPSQPDVEPDSCAEPQASAAASPEQQLASESAPGTRAALEHAAGEMGVLAGGLLRQAMVRRVEGLRLGPGSTRRHGLAGLALPHSVPPLVAAHAGRMSMHWVL